MARLKLSGVGDYEVEICDRIETGGKEEGCDGEKSEEKWGCVWEEYRACEGNEDCDSVDVYLGSRGDGWRWEPNKIEHREGFEVLIRNVSLMSNNFSDFAAAIPGRESGSARSYWAGYLDSALKGVACRTARGKSNARDEQTSIKLRSNDCLACFLEWIFEDPSIFPWFPHLHA